MSCRITAIILCCTLYASLVSATTWHVPGDAATIKGGIGLASANDTVLVACGTYYEHDIRLKSGVCLRSETGDASCVTIDAQGQDRVIYCRFVASTASIEGFTITGGDAYDGGGLYCLDNSSPMVRNCVITGNLATDRGGGVHCYTNSSPTFVNCTIAGNSAESGGGMHCLDNSDPTLTDCTFSDNSATSGAGMSCYNYCTPTFANCTFSDNVASMIGGGIQISRECEATFTDCTISSNTADSRGGGMITSFGGSAILTNCTFSGNSSVRGAGMALGGNATLTNCSFAGNSAINDGGAMMLSGTAAIITLNHCSLLRNSAKNGGAIYMEGASYLAADSTEFRNNTVSNEGARGYIESTSEAVLTCCVTDLSGFAGDGTITLNNDGCWVPIERTTWGRLKALYR
jgi:predicted outer membrane repeat protein